MEIDLVIQDGARIKLTGVAQGVCLEVKDRDGRVTQAGLFIYEAERLSRALALLTDKEP